MTESSLEELDAQRRELFGRGSVSQSYRRCGKANCACAGPVIRGTGRG
jgi:hypothetical protein